MRWGRWAVLSAALAVAACGKGTEGYRVETRELTPAEIAARGYVLDDAAEEGGAEATTSPARSASGKGEAIINALAGAVLDVLRAGQLGAEATIIAHAVPRGAGPLDLVGGRSASKVYEKRVTSLLGAELIRLEYRVSFQYGASYRGKGSYLTNVKFTPLQVTTTSGWAMSASAVSEQPRNVGTVADPVAALGFSLSFTASGPGRRMLVTDEFSIHGRSGEVTASTRNF